MSKMLTIGCVVTLGLAAAFWLWSPKARPVAMSTPQSAQRIREHPSQVTKPSQAGSINRSNTAPPLVSSEGPRQRMRTAKNYLELALSLLPEAKAGNAEAQYVLFTMLRTCQIGVAGLYGQQFDTVEKAREYAAVRNHSTEEAETLFRLCHGLFTPVANILGNPWEWLQKATDAGYPAAQADTAAERLSQDRLKASLPNGGTAQDIAALPPIGGDADPRALLAAALPSGDPAVLADIGQLQHMLHPEEPRQVTRRDRIAWLYLACERGNDCSNLGPTSPINCTATDTHCMGVPSMLMMMAQDNWAPIQERVNELSAALDAKQWDKLGFGR